MSASFSSAENATPIHAVTPQNLPQTLAALDDAAHAWVTGSGFAAKLGELALIPNANGSLRAVLVGWGDEAARARGRFHMATIAARLPEGDYRFADGLDAGERAEAALAWLLAAYRFDRYRKQASQAARLVAPNGIDAARILAEARATYLTRDLINTPANDMTPAALEAAITALALRHNARVSAIVGDDLLKENLPMIHAVGRAATDAPRLVDLIWGDENHPKITLVGKGVCFDTGGLNLKPAASMGLMKKDMGGAATAIGLAQMIMELNLPVRLRLLVPAVENSVSANAFRPQDILTSRKGLTVEINNTDAEGRLVLADALTLADEESPEILLCLATLTGAARVALGPDIPPFYTDDDTFAGQISEASSMKADPLWRMPFHTPYDSLIEPGIADLDNAPSGGMAGSITAALFLRRFVEQARTFVHFDLYGWVPAALPARPKGGEMQAARAMLAAIEAHLK
ncbi:MAG: leucyl aminopeptidase family protein [Paracoccaceae bacterium]